MENKALVAVIFLGLNKSSIKQLCFIERIPINLELNEKIVSRQLQLITIDSGAFQHRQYDFEINDLTLKLSISNYTFNFKDIGYFSKTVMHCLSLLPQQRNKWLVARFAVPQASFLGPVLPIFDPLHFYVAFQKLMNCS